MGSDNNVRVLPVTEADDITRCFEIAAATFGKQTADDIWIAFNPGWDTPEGKMKGISRMRDQWSTATVDRAGQLNTIFLKGTVLDSAGSEVMAGMALWLQISTIVGYGDAPRYNLAEAMDLDTLYPGDPSTHRYLCQMDKSLTKQRVKCVEEAASLSPPAVLVLELCAVDPAFQRRGVASKLVQWGVDEAARRGGLEAVVEASTMGKPLYSRLGFEQDGPEIEYHLDDEFKDRVHLSNVFMRTGRP
ncbi:hypothetical protein F5Y00DRAFT_272828 [Daldinia vernicosa]|uniref:uncharacterized protein n=1 Tax=Daldinia vernicosa TaxID=114800 RepID=UPI0020078E7D|nr:uncharacterized protein F5Y00DRAFT_272828 [Daldinia vernicosa]KAI0845508.1 hypothetical protein F5Y00DRAFT_272828 [Daldinia vernicosa]